MYRRKNYGGPVRNYAHLFSKDSIFFVGF